MVDDQLKDCSVPSFCGCGTSPYHQLFTAVLETGYEVFLLKFFAWFLPNLLLENFTKNLYLLSLLIEATQVQWNGAIFNTLHFGLFADTTISWQRRQQAKTSDANQSFASFSTFKHPWCTTTTLGQSKEATHLSLHGWCGWKISVQIR